MNEVCSCGTPLLIDRPNNGIYCFNCQCGMPLTVYETLYYHHKPIAEIEDIMSGKSKHGEFHDKENGKLV